MTVTAAVPLLVAALGAAVYLVATRQKWPALAELARACWWCGLLVFLFGLAGRVVHL
jgi:hypothetical protein